jgi:hypothetical protein
MSAALMRSLSVFGCSGHVLFDKFTGDDTSQTAPALKVELGSLMDIHEELISRR